MSPPGFVRKSYRGHLAEVQSELHKRGQAVLISLRSRFQTCLERIDQSDQCEAEKATAVAGNARHSAHAISLPCTHRGLSSAGRAPDLHSGGHRFDPDRLHHHLPGEDGLVAQVVRAYA